MINPSDPSWGEIEKELIEKANWLFTAISFVPLEQPKTYPSPPDGVLFLWTRGDRCEGRWADLHIKLENTFLTTSEFKAGKSSHRRYDNLSADLMLVDRIVEWLDGADFS